MQVEIKLQQRLAPAAREKGLDPVYDTEQQRRQQHHRQVLGEGLYNFHSKSPMSVTTMYMI